jgi:hypothetical protein
MRKRPLLRAALAALLALQSFPGTAGAQEAPAVPEGQGTEAGTDQAPATPAPPLTTIQRVIRALGKEARRYGTDSAAFFTAPLRWDGSDWKKAGGVTLVLGGLFLADEKLDHEAQNNRSRFTDRVSAATTRLGGSYGVDISVALFASGLVFKDDNVRDMGREAIEAGVITQLINNLFLKRAFGRERPYRSNGETDFDVGSNNSSFPSGHATEAFSVASVVAMRSRGWVIPALAYTAASIVAFDRVNDRVHFPSDVFAGAVLGTVTGRLLVSRHRQQEAGIEPKLALEIVPIRHGLQARLSF